MHQFVVFSQMLTSYIATLAYYEKPLASKFADPSWQPVVDSIVRCLEAAVVALRDGTGSPASAQAPPPARFPPAATEPAMIKPVEDQFGFIGKLSGDMYKVSLLLHEALRQEERPTG